MNPFENQNFGNPPISPALEGLDLGKLTEEHVQSGLAGSERSKMSEGPEFAGEGVQRIALPTVPNRENRI